MGEEKSELPEMVMGTESPEASGHQRRLCLSKQRGKLKPLMKRPPVSLQKPPEGNGGSGLVACGDPIEGEGRGKGHLGPQKIVPMSSGPCCTAQQAPD